MVGVKAHAVADVTGDGAAVSQGKRDGILRLSREYVSGDFQGLAPVLELDDVAALYAARLGRSGADERRVVPRQFGEEIWKFLQPGIVGEPAVPHLAIRNEDEFQMVRVGLFRRIGSLADQVQDFGQIQGKMFFAMVIVGGYAVMEKAPPKGFEGSIGGVGIEIDFSDRLADNVVSPLHRITGECGQQFNHG